MLVKIATLSHMVAASKLLAVEDLPLAMLSSIPHEYFVDATSRYPQYVPDRRYWEADVRARIEESYAYGTDIRDCRQDSEHVAQTVAVMKLHNSNFKAIVKGLAHRLECLKARYQMLQVRDVAKELEFSEHETSLVIGCTFLTRPLSTACSQNHAPFTKLELSR